MLIVGNQKAQNILTTFFDKIKNQGNISFNFLLLEGDSHLGKTTLIEKLAQQLLGNYFLTDFLHIKDLSEKLGKKHHLKIDNDEIIKLDDGTQYKDLGARQIIDWIWKGAFGQYKILYLENIERFSISAANAFLKTFEEPIKNTLIIASTRSKYLLLDTIVSRSFIISFNNVPLNEIEKNIGNFLTYDKFEKFKNKKELIYSIAGGKPGLIIDILDNMILEENTVYDILLEQLERFLNLQKLGNNTIEKFDILKKFNEEGHLDIFLNSMIFYYSSKKDFQKTQFFMEIQKNIKNTAVNIDNILFKIALL